MRDELNAHLFCYSHLISFMVCCGKNKEYSLVYLLCTQSPDIILFVCLMFKKLCPYRKNVINT